MSHVIARGKSLGMPYRRLGKTDWSVSAVGLGCAPLGDVYGDLPHRDRLDIVQTAFDSGVNIFDTSPFYGESKSESNLGRCLAELAKDNTEMYQRDQYYLCSKVGRYAAGKHDYSAKRVQLSIQHSLERLHTDYLDCVNIHDFEFVGFYPDNDDGSLPQIWEETLPALEELKQKGVIGAYGLSGKPLVCIDYVARQYGYDKLSTILTYNNYNLTDERLNMFMPRIKKYDIGVMQGGVSLLGLLTPQGPQPWNNAPQLIKDRCREAVELVRAKTLGSEQEKRLSILRLAFLHALSNTNLHTILVGPTNAQQLQCYVDWIRDSEVDKIYNDDYLSQPDKELIDELQHGVFADIMNLGWVEDGTQYNICEATFESPHWRDILHYTNA